MWPVLTSLLDLCICKSVVGHTVMANAPLMVRYIMTHSYEQSLVIALDRNV